MYTHTLEEKLIKSHCSIASSCRLTTLHLRYNWTNTLFNARRLLLSNCEASLPVLKDIENIILQLTAFFVPTGYLKFPLQFPSGFDVLVESMPAVS